MQTLFFCMQTFFFTVSLQCSTILRACVFIHVCLFMCVYSCVFIHVCTDPTLLPTEVHNVLIDIHLYWFFHCVDVCIHSSVVQSIFCFLYGFLVRCVECSPCLQPAEVQSMYIGIGWLRLVGSLKLQVSFAKEPCKRDDILQKRLIILRSLQIVATPYTSLLIYIFISIHIQ